MSQDLGQLLEIKGLGTIPILDSVDQGNLCIFEVKVVLVDDDDVGKNVSEQPS